jgi:8-oxo-dGTP pyrophosphatase MutT (NUDIX family)
VPAEQQGGRALSPVRQAGAIAARAVDHKLEILIVRARRSPENWIFPKGHIEPRESAEDAAVRELEEEAGVTGSMIGPLGVVDFGSKENIVRVEYFLVRYRRDVPREEDRETRWCSYGRALELLAWPDTKTLLRDARARIEQAIGKVS